MRYCLALIIVAACGSALPSYDYAKEPDPRNKELVLGVGDVVGINVWDQKELNTDATIRPDRTITMPLVGDLQAAGETPSALKEKIATALAKYLKLGAGNEITVAVRAWKSYRFTIVGEVTKPGVFTSDTYQRVSEALAMASGPTRFAKRSGIRILRQGPPPREIPIDYDLVSSGKRPDMDIWVLPGDLIWVP